MKNIKNNYISNEIRKKISQEHITIESIYIEKSNQIIMENYFKGNSNTLRLVASMITSLLSCSAIGILLETELLKSIDLKLSEIFKEEFSKYNISQLKDITVSNVLAKTTGIIWPGPGEYIADNINSISFLEKLEAGEKPGTQFKYKPDPQIVNWIVQKLTGMKFIEFIDKYLFQPLSITRYDIEPGPNGPQLFLSTKSIAKIGKLYLNMGKSNNSQILNREFITKATQKQTVGGFPEENPYGYFWWITRLNKHNFFYASGIGGQYLFVSYELNIIMVITSEVGRGKGAQKLLLRDYLELGKDNIGENEMAKGKIKLELNQKQEMVAKLKQFYLEERDEEIGDLAADIILDFFLDSIAPIIFNKGVDESRKFLLSKIEDLEIEMDGLLK